MQTKVGYVKDWCAWMVLGNYRAATVDAYTGALRQIFSVA